jgi:hypothetical protein
MFLVVALARDATALARDVAASPAVAALAVGGVAIPAVLACNVLAVLVAGPSRPRKAAAIGLSGLAFVLAAAFPPPFPALRGWLWLAAAMMAMRVVDVLGMVADRPDAATRLAQLLLVYDQRDMRPAAPRLAPDLVLRALAYGALAALALLFAALTPPPWRWLGGGLHFYALLEAADAGFRALFTALGLRARPLQARPYLSVTLAEFWGRRWNREVGRWIHRTCFLPLARRGWPALGVLAGFAWSATFHGAAAWAAAGPTAAAVMASFFLAHGVLLLAERGLGVSHWPRWAGHIWVVAVFVVTVPLFAEPLLQLMGVPPSGATTHLPTTHPSTSLPDR